MVLSMKKLYASQEKNKNKNSELKFLHISVPHLSVKQRGYFLRQEIQRIRQYFENTVSHICSK